MLFTHTVYSLLVRASSFQFSSAVYPDPLGNVTLYGCSVNEEERNASLLVTWQVPGMTFGRLVNCSFNISAVGDPMENATNFTAYATAEVGNTGIYKVIQEWWAGSSSVYVVFCVQDILCTQI